MESQLVKVGIVLFGISFAGLMVWAFTLQARIWHLI
jgi:hypothetical protein